MNQTDEILNAAIEYLDRGFSVIPVKRSDKRPYFEWEEFQHRHPTPDEIEAWWKEWPQANVAIVTGQISGIAVVDADGPGGAQFVNENFPPTTVKAQSYKGPHRYFKTNGTIVHCSTKTVHPEVDIRGEGGYIVAPPSIHATGHKYQFEFLLNGWDDLSEYVPPKGESVTDAPLRLDLGKIEAGLSDGERNDMLFREASRLRGKNLSEGEAWIVLKSYASRCVPPYTDEKQLERTLRSAWKYAPNEPSGAGEFELFNADEIIRDLSPPEFLIDKYVEAKTTGQIFGPWGEYKTFVAISMVCSVATGTPWMGHPVKQGPVVYILGEGHGGFGRRLRAWCMYHNVKGFDGMLFVSKKPAQMTVRESAESVKRAIDAYAAKVGPPELIVLDTLNRNFGPGNENSTDDMTKFVCHLDQYVRGDANVMTVHHSGHLEKSRGRGSSALPAAIDTEYKVFAPRQMLCTIQCTKMKDAPHPPVLNFDMQRVILGEVAGQVVDSLVATFKCEGVLTKATVFKGDVDKALQALRCLYMNQRGNLERGGFNPMAAKVFLEDWKRECLDGIYKNQRTFNNMKTRLIESETIQVDGTFVYLNEVMEEC